MYKTTTGNFTSDARELDVRSADGIDVRLYWHPSTESLTVSVFDTTNEQAFDLLVEPAKAYDAFHHPFAHAAFQGIPFAVRLRAHEDPIAA